MKRDMAHSVTITTPRLTVRDTANQFGLSAKDLKFVASLFESKKSGDSNSRAVKQRTSSSRLTLRSAKRSAGTAKRATARARKVA